MDRQRVINILLEEAAKSEQRYDNYSRDITECIVEIIELERQHKLAARNIKQDIAAKIDACAGLLVQRQGGDGI